MWSMNVQAKTVECPAPKLSHATMPSDVQKAGHSIVRRVSCSATSSTCQSRQSVLHMQPQRACFNGSSAKRAARFNVDSQPTVRQPCPQLGTFCINVYHHSWLEEIVAMLTCAKGLSLRPSLWSSAQPVGECIETGHFV